MSTQTSGCQGAKRSRGGTTASIRNAVQARVCILTLRADRKSGTMRRCTTLAWPATRRAVRLAWHPISGQCEALFSVSRPSASYEQFIGNVAALGKNKRVPDGFLYGVPRIAPRLRAKAPDEVTPEFRHIGFGAGKEDGSHTRLASARISSSIASNSANTASASYTRPSSMSRLPMASIFKSARVCSRSS